MAGEKILKSLGGRGLPLGGGDLWREGSEERGEGCGENPALVGRGWASIGATCTGRCGVGRTLRWLVAGGTRERLRCRWGGEAGGPRAAGSSRARLPGHLPPHVTSSGRAGCGSPQARNADFILRLLLVSFIL